MNKTHDFQVSLSRSFHRQTPEHWFVLTASLLFSCGGTPGSSDQTPATPGAGSPTDSSQATSEYYCGLPFGAEKPKGHYRNGKATVDEAGGKRELTEFTCQTLRALNGSALGYLAVFADRTADDPDEERRWVLVESRDGTNAYMGDGTYEGGFSGPLRSPSSGTLHLSNGGKHGELDDGSLVFDCDPTDDTEVTKAPAFSPTVTPGSARVIDSAGAVVTIPDVHCSGYNNVLSVNTGPGVEAYYIMTDPNAGFRLDYPGIASDAFTGGLLAKTTPSCEAGHATLKFVVTDSQAKLSYSGEVACQLND